MRSDSCAVLFAFDSGFSTSRVALTGDSRAMGAQLSPGPDKHMVDVLTEDQNLHNSQEQTHITATHPRKDGDRINMALDSRCHRWERLAELGMLARGTRHSPRP
ncbi:hypothetical protein MY4824_008653 [Beauveria thailandica]